MRSEESRDAGEALLRRLQRLVARAATVRGGDRRHLLALIDEIETARRGLLRECAEIESEMRQATVRKSAIGAYLRNAQVSRGRRTN
ncbi:hypothetical protein CO669_13565 [Bradyrhizobium sp. Y36]|uniref:hypothetical protein n=1 Tax=Bradyrhizobium sp. Y36 TaxID=2035447 RepID=UPI000BE9C2A6|nr:hypothetical protein [Bradyrhizobium sp. Y36]PDT89811.1 hypothetical protein CO669_13565 [Bradyrhizobium sp. Y36]